MAKKMTKLKSKMKKVMKEYGAGELHSGSKSGPTVTNPKQAVAIAYSEAKHAKKKHHSKKVTKDFMKGKEEMHEKIERKQDRKKLPMPSKKKAVKSIIKGEEVLHEYMEEKLHGKGGSMPRAEYMKKSHKSSSRKGTGEKPDKVNKGPVLEFVGAVKPSDLENGKRKPATEHASKFAEEIAKREARKAGVKEKKRVNYFPKKGK